MCTPPCFSFFGIVLCRRKSEKLKTFGRTDRHGAHCVFLSCTFLFFYFFLSLRFFFVMAAFAAFFFLFVFLFSFLLANVRLSMSMIQGKMGMRDKQPSHEPRSFFVYLFFYFFLLKKKAMDFQRYSNLFLCVYLIIIGQILFFVLGNNTNVKHETWNRVKALKIKIRPITAKRDSIDRRFEEIRFFFRFDLLEFDWSYVFVFYFFYYKHFPHEIL